MRAWLLTRARAGGDVRPTVDGRAASAVERLARAGCVAADEEAALLLVDEPDDGLLERRVQRREAGEPIAWIVGGCWFCGRWVLVSTGVYVPRPQTEDLARRAASLLPVGGRALDVCCGSGAIAAHLSAEVPGATVAAFDIDPVAVRCAQLNGVAAVVADVGRLPAADGSVDLITAVAPYVPTPELAFLPADVIRYEPRQALDGGPDGLDVVRALIPEAARALRPGGHLLLELGGTQEIDLASTLRSAGFSTVDRWLDDDGDLRGLTAHL
jgi:release factor glutamine methyltransferase